MGWYKKYSQSFHREKENGLRIGCWNKGGALQPLKEKVNEIEHLIKSNNFAILGITEANFYEEHDVNEVTIDGYNFVWDKGRNQSNRKNSRCVVYIRKDLSFKLRSDLMRESFPEVWIEAGEAGKLSPFLYNLVEKGWKTIPKFIVFDWNF